MLLEYQKEITLIESTLRKNCKDLDLFLRNFSKSWTTKFLVRKEI